MGTLHNKGEVKERERTAGADGQRVGKLHQLLDILMSLGELEVEQGLEFKEGSPCEVAAGGDSFVGLQRNCSGVPGGPCAHCGVTTSPQWRRPPPKKVVFCNACGIYLKRHKTLPQLELLVHTRKEAPSAAVRVEAEGRSSRAGRPYKRPKESVVSTPSSLEDSFLSTESPTPQENPRRAAKRGKSSHQTGEKKRRGFSVSPGLSVSNDESLTVHQQATTLVSPVKQESGSVAFTGPTKSFCSTPEKGGKLSPRASEKFKPELVMLLPKRFSSGPRLKLRKLPSNSIPSLSIKP